MLCRVCCSAEASLSANYFQFAPIMTEKLFISIALDLPQRNKKKTVLANLPRNDLQALGSSELVHVEYCDMILYDFKVMFICGV